MLFESLIYKQKSIIQKQCKLTEEVEQQVNMNDIYKCDRTNWKFRRGQLFRHKCFPFPLNMLFFDQPERFLRHLKIKRFYKEKSFIIAI